MKEISQQEFEQKIEDIINGKLTRKKLSILLDTDCRTINRKIMDLSILNPELYKRFINKFPYRPKSIEVGSINNLAIYVIENGLEATVEKYGISKRTIARKVGVLKEKNPELYEMYIERNKIEITEEELEQYREEELAKEINEMDAKRYELILLFKEFDRLLKEGYSKAEAARKMGYDDYPTIWKKANELKRIVTEQNLKNENKMALESHDDEEPDI